jgi:hypothetical protein
MKWIPFEKQWPTKKAMKCYGTIIVLDYGQPEQLEYTIDPDTGKLQLVVERGRDTFGITHWLKVPIRPGYWKRAKSVAELVPLL